MNGDPSFPGGSIPVLAAMFLVTLCRVSAMVMTAPGLGETTSPMTVRAGIAMVTTFTVLPLVQERLASVSGPAIHHPFIMLAIIASELLCGAFIGYLARLMTLAMAIAMEIIAVFTGMASVLQPDPELGSSSTALSHMASSLIPVIFLSTGLYVLPLTALIGSYALFPPGHMPMIGDMARSVMTTTGQTFALALQLAAPFILIGTLWPAMLGVLNRLMPSIQVYGIAMPAQLLGGILLLAMLLQVLTGVWQERMNDLLVALPGTNMAARPH
ncbi:flagellar biosynthetic protein FliR [Gluconacetobacter takamatsuzukensis]|uniref:Flagellar biosynthetic protein FliR n=1 Tax=Gluconacetobacter takamatsuzukensis TaxID=1286190 RepID=A0A7W4KAY9_9PROT|nr:flagellar biosynthetic protein FliR [Gluconacetobacter takamatsuzukensis]